MKLKIVTTPPDGGAGYGFRILDTATGEEVEGVQNASLFMEQDKENLGAAIWKLELTLGVFDIDFEIAGESTEGDS